MIKSDNEFHVEIEQKIIDGQAIILREGPVTDGKVQYIASIQFDGIIIMRWKLSHDTKLWQSEPMNWLMLHNDEVKVLQDFLKKIN